MLEKYVCVVPKSIAIPFIASTPRLMQKLHGKKVNKNFLKEARWGDLKHFLCIYICIYIFINFTFVMRPHEHQADESVMGWCQHRSSVLRLLRLMSSSTGVRGQPFKHARPTKSR
jgi:hypothetical protein